MANPGTQNHHCRKVIQIGDSVGVVIPPHVLDHLGVVKGDFLIWDLNSPGFGILSHVKIPPYVTKPDTFPTLPP